MTVPTLRPADLDASPRAPTVSIVTLGCKLNQAEAEELALSLRQRGYHVLAHEAPADVYVVNTCSVTHVADQKARQLIRRLRRNSPESRVVVLGCYAERAPDEIMASAGVDVIANRSDRERLPDIVQELAPIAAAVAEHPSEHSTCTGLGRARSLIKVGDGCNKFCSYCIVPFARGREQSEPLISTVDAVQQRVRDGCLEVVLTAVNLGRWESQLASGQTATLADLVDQILEKTDIRRVRLSSIEPEDFRDELFGRLLSGRVCRHLHLPLQSGSDTVLRRMRRRYDVSGYRALVEKLRSKVPGIAITTDVMVGFPGETDDEFDQTRRFVEQMGFSAIHVFRYSPRAGTDAAVVPNQVPAPKKAHRAGVLAALADDASRRFRRQFVGRHMEVLYEGLSSQGCDDSAEGPCSLWEGLTDNYIRVYCRSSRNLANHLIVTRLDTEHGDGLIGEPGSLSAAREPGLGHAPRALESGE